MQRTVRAAQKLIMTKIYSKTLIEINFPEELSGMCSFVRCITFLDQVKCHQNHRPMQNPPPSPAEQASITCSSCKWHPLDNVRERYYQTQESGASQEVSMLISSWRVALGANQSFNWNIISAIFFKKKFRCATSCFTLGRQRIRWISLTKAQKELFLFPKKRLLSGSLKLIGGAYTY